MLPLDGHFVLLVGQVGSSPAVQLALSGVLENVDCPLFFFEQLVVVEVHLFLVGGPLQLLKPQPFVFVRLFVAPVHVLFQLLLSAFATQVAAA